MEQSIGEHVYKRAQEALRTSINDRARPLGWGLRYIMDAGWTIRWVGADRWRNDQYVVLYDSIWQLARDNPKGIEAEAVEWLRRNNHDAYRRLRAGVGDYVPLRELDRHPAAYGARGE